MLKVISLLFVFVIAPGSVYGQSGASNYNQPSIPQTSSGLLATSVDEDSESVTSDKRTTRLLNEYIQQLIRDQEEIVGCMEG